MIGTKKQKSRGQAMVEFALVMPILAFVILGIFDFARVMFTYAQGSYQMRSALRYASAVGYSGGSTPYYLDCTKILTEAGYNWFGTVTSKSMKYKKAYGGSDINCTSTGQVTANDLVNGDMLELTVDLQVVFIAFPAQSLNVTFKGQRTIVKEIELGAAVNDDDFDGLDDTWEFGYWSSTDTFLATDDPDGDGCNNGCEESRGTDPTFNDKTYSLVAQTTLDNTSVQLAYLETFGPVSNFVATVSDCNIAGNNVTFSCDVPAGSANELAAGQAIFYKYDPDAETVTAVWGSGITATPQTDKADIDVDDEFDYFMTTRKPYYVNGVMTWVTGPASDLITIDCTPPPPPADPVPTGFAGTCSKSGSGPGTTYTFSFSWDDSPWSTMPDAIYIHDGSVDRFTISTPVSGQSTTASYSLSYSINSTNINVTFYMQTETGGTRSADSTGINFKSSGAGANC